MSTVYLIPCPLAEDAYNSLPAYILPAIKSSTVIFAEQERTARRFLKKLDREIVIDDFEWFPIHKAEAEQIKNFTQKVKENKNICIISEAGCPGIADPGQLLIEVAQKLNCKVVPLVGPSSILLALMASGMNGQQFEFCGYLPIEHNERIKRIKELENSSQKNKSTKIFIETPYRNNALIDTLLKTCLPQTQLCLGVNITAADEWIKTKTIENWKKELPILEKVPAIFLIYAG
jgi:16S rRNA (cytidine1402-2'-O)-methyltransferase